MTRQPDPDSRADQFEKIARDRRHGNLLSDFWSLARENRKWWLVPFVLVLLLVGGVLVLSGTALAPFIYTLF